MNESNLGAASRHATGHEQKEIGLKAVAAAVRYQSADIGQLMRKAAALANPGEAMLKATAAGMAAARKHA
jgi:hypothetical protein